MGDSGGLPANFAKGVVHRAIDAQLNTRDENGNFSRRDEILRLLRVEDNSFVDMLKTVFQVPAGPADYVAAHWFNDPNARETWWKDKQPIEPIVRHSLIHSIELAGDLPIDSYWVPIGNRNVHTNNYRDGAYRSDEFPFEIAISRGEYQLTRLVITPPSPRPTRLDLFNQPVDLWVVQSRYEPWPTGNSAPDGDVVMTRLHEYNGPAEGGYDT